MLSTAAGAAHAAVTLQTSANVSPGNGTGAGGEITYTTFGGSDGGTFNNTSGLPTTVSFSSTTLTGQNSSFAQYQVSQSTIRSASASATANLAQGIVGLSASTSADPSGVNGGGMAHAQASVSDQLTFSVAGASSGTTTLIGVTFTLTGTLSTMGGTAGIDLPGFDFEGLTNGNTDGNVVYASDTTNGITALSASSAWVSFDFTGTTSQNLIFNGVYALVGPSEVVDVNFNPIASVSAGMSDSDYSATGELSLSLPAGVTFTSPDGFLANPAPAPLIGNGRLSVLTVGAVLLGASLLGRSKKRRGLGTAIPHAAG